MSKLALAADSHKAIGDIGELIAERYLLHNGMKILAKNWRCRYGEIDILASFHRTLIFVEVKYVRSTNFCSAVELFHYKKKAHIQRSINIFLKTYPRFINSWRFDLLCLTQDSNRVWVEHYKNALSFNDG